METIDIIEGADEVLQIQINKKLTNLSIKNLATVKKMASDCRSLWSSSSASPLYETRSLIHIPPQELVNSLYHFFLQIGDCMMKSGGRRIQNRLIAGNR